MTDPNQTQPRGRVLPPAREPSRETIVERQRMRRVTGLRPYAAVACIAIGVFPFLAEMYRYYVRNVPIRGGPMAIGALFGFVGFYLLDPKDSLTGGSFIVNSTVAIIGVIRGGRRATDPAVVVTKPIAPPDDQGEKGA